MSAFDAATEAALARLRKEGVAAARDDAPPPRRDAAATAPERAAAPSQDQAGEAEAPQQPRPPRHAPTKPVGVGVQPHRMAARDQSLTRMASSTPEPDRVQGLPADHPAVVEGRTLFPSTVVSTFESARFLVSGHNNPKLGKEFRKGPWDGFPLYHVTLEERATCPRSCLRWHDCLAPGTRVLTADLRWQPIESLSIGQRIIGFDEELVGVGRWGEASGHRMTRVATVTGLGRAVRPSVRVRTDRGEVTASAGHLFLARRMGGSSATRAYKFEWLRSDELKPGYQIRFFVEPWEHDRSYEAGRLRGFVEGEGTCGVFDNEGFPKPRIGWAQRPGRLLDEINAIARQLGFDIAVYPRVSGVNGSDVHYTDVLGGWRAVWRFLGTIRPTRLLDKMEAALADHSLSGRGAETATVEAVESVGEIEVVTIETSTKTLVAEGFAVHNCYGNGMHLARRNDHRDPDFLAALKAEVVTVARQHPGGFVVRLHTLGDFFSVDYVRLWADLIDTLPNLHVFGYTARREDADDEESRTIAKAIRWLTEQAWDVFAIRFSGHDGPQGTIVVTEPDARESVIMCPAQEHATAACATCGLCSAAHARDKTIAFLLHGRKTRGPGKEPSAAEPVIDRHPREATSAEPAARAEPWAHSLAIAERDAEIAKRYAAGEDVEAIARPFGIKPQYVRVIANRLGARRPAVARERGPILPQRDKVSDDERALIDDALAKGVKTNCRPGYAFGASPGVQTTLGSASYGGGRVK